MCENSSIQLSKSLPLAIKFVRHEHILDINTIGILFNGQWAPFCETICLFVIIHFQIISYFRKKVGQVVLWVLKFPPNGSKFSLNLFTRNSLVHDREEIKVQL